MNNLNEEPSIAPEPNRWYNITLGPSLLSDGHSYNSPRFCTLRYEFKPASIDNTKPGSFHKSDDNRVTLEFQNNQIGKPKVSFDGVSEDYNDKDKDAILFFDGETFRLEKLHRAVKRLKYQRVPGESAAASITESYSQPVSRAANVAPPVANTVKVAEIDINNPVSLDHENEEDPYSSAPNPTVYESEEDVNIDDDDDENDNDGQQSARKSTKEFRTGGLDIDINLPHPAEMEDDEIADVDINDEESYKGLNAAEALRAQVNAEAREEERKSSRSSSGRESESCESGAESSGSGSSGSSSSKSRNSGSESGTASESGSRASH